MADEHADQSGEGVADKPKAKGRGLFRIIKAGAFVSVIVIVQVVVVSDAIVNVPSLAQSPPNVAS